MLHRRLHFSGSSHSLLQTCWTRHLLSHTAGTSSKIYLHEGNSGRCSLCLHGRGSCSSSSCNYCSGSSLSQCYLSIRFTIISTTSQLQQPGKPSRLESQAFYSDLQEFPSSNQQQDPKNSQVPQHYCRLLS